ncbi:MAG: hypothetical protein ACK2T3_05650 [Candidatus Promineifilaceae bacterium]|jgi:hypothetical protein
MKNYTDPKSDRSIGLYMAGMAIGFIAGIALGIAMGNIAIGVAIGGGMGISLGIAFQQSAQEEKDAPMRQPTSRIVLVVVGLLILLALSALLFLMLI